MNDPLGVCCIQCLRNLDGEGQTQLGFQRPAWNVVLQRKAIQKLHGDVRLVTVLADVVNGADVGVVESGGGASLTSEAFQ